MFEVVQAAFRQGVLLFFVESGLIDINFTSLFILRQCLFTNRYFNVMAFVAKSWAQSMMTTTAYMFLQVTFRLNIVTLKLLTDKLVCSLFISQLKGEDLCNRKPLCNDLLMIEAR